jgi:hypothetical protein
MPARATRHRPGTACLALGATALLSLVVTGCSGGAETTPPGGLTASIASPTSAAPPATSASPSATATTPTASPSVFPTAPVASSGTGTGPGASGALPSAQLQQGPYEGEPRRLEDIFHLECLHALDGADLPEREDADVDEGEKPVWSVHSRQALTEGWKACPTRMYEQIAIPAVFTVQAETAQGGGSISRLSITDSDGQVLGGFQDNVTGSAPARTELVEVLGITELPPVPSTEGEIRYLRTLVVDTRSGPQLLIDQVSAPAQADPASLKAWDLAAGGDRRALVYASIRLDTPDDGRQMATSDLAVVLRSMVDSFVPAVM